MPELSIGKWRGLQQCATAQGALAVLALDHRQGLRKTMRPSAPDSVTPAELAAFKQEVVGALAPAASAVLLDPEVGAGGEVGAKVKVFAPAAYKLRLIDLTGFKNLSGLGFCHNKLEFVTNLGYYTPRFLLF